MPKIEIKHKGATLEDTVFEKSGISLEFNTESVEHFIQELEMTKAQTEQELMRLEVFIGKTEIKETPVDSKDLENFGAYVRYKNQLKTAQERIQELSEEHPDFIEKYEALSDEEKHNMPKFVDFIMHRSKLELDLKMNDEELEKYKADLETAKSLCQSEE